MELYKAKLAQIGDQRNELERLSREIANQAQLRDVNGNTLIQLNEFCYSVSSGLAKMTFEERQNFIRLVVDTIVLEDGRIRVETIIPPDHDGTLRNSRRELIEPPFEISC